MQISSQTQAGSDLQSHLWPKGITAAALVLSNLVIVALALKEQWGFLQILYVCWFEAIIIGLYNFLKMVVVVLCGGPFGRIGSRLSFENKAAVGFFGLIALGLYVVKFIGITLATGFLLLMLPAKLKALETGRPVPGYDAFPLMTDGFQAVAGGLPIILLGLVISHGISFVVDFLGRREYQRAKIWVLLFWPYARMALVMMVMTGAGLVAVLAPPLARTTVFAVTVVCVKLVADLATHAFEHSRKTAVPPPIPVESARCAARNACASI